MKDFIIGVFVSSLIWGGILCYNNILHQREMNNYREDIVDENYDLRNKNKKLIKEVTNTYNEISRLKNGLLGSQKVNPKYSTQENQIRRFGEILSEDRKGTKSKLQGISVGQEPVRPNTETSSY